MPQVPDDIVFGRYLGLLSTEERQYVATAAYPALQRERILSRALVRTTLARYCSDAVRWTMTRAEIYVGRNQNESDCLESAVYPAASCQRPTHKQCIGQQRNADAPCSTQI